jgi:hypothetical protein
MFKLTLSSKSKEHLAIKERLEALSLARKIDIVEQLDYPVLRHDNKNFTGVTEIMTYLDEFDLFYDRWYECRCDKYEFD